MLEEKLKKISNLFVSSSSLSEQEIKKRKLNLIGEKHGVAQRKILAYHLVLILLQLEMMMIWN